MLCIQSKLSCNFSQQPSFYCLYILFVSQNFSLFSFSFPLPSLFLIDLFFSFSLFFSPLNYTRYTYSLSFCSTDLPTSPLLFTSVGHCFSAPRPLPLFLQTFLHLINQEGQRSLRFNMCIFTKQNKQEGNKHGL